MQFNIASSGDTALQTSDVTESQSSDYHDALAAYVATGSEHSLMQAYTLARAALSAKRSIVDFWASNTAAVAKLASNQNWLPESSDRATQFALEFLSVYDMALKGYERTLPILTDQIAERQRIEHQLRAATVELAIERDGLEERIALRTQELAEKATDLEKANEHLRQINKEQAAFTYSLSHDLKSPGNTITMLVEELFQMNPTTLTDESADLLALIQQTSRRMGRLVDDVLEYSRCIEVQPDHGPVNLAELIPDLLADLRYDIARTNARIEHANLPIVRGDRMQLKVLLQNLVANGLKFHRQGCPPRLLVNATDIGPRQVSITVCDNGIGIAKDHLDRIFVLFQRLHSHEEYEGSGIGLALCRRIAFNHGSDVVVESSLGRGSSFSIILERFTV